MDFSDDRIVNCFRRARKVPCIGIILGLLSGVFAATAGFIVKLVPNIHPGMNFIHLISTLVSF